MALRKILRLNQILEATGLKRTSLYQLIAADKFPAPLRLGERAIGFYEDEVAAWCQTRERGTDSVAGRRLRMSRAEHERRPALRRGLPAREETDSDAA